MMDDGRGQKKNCFLRTTIMLSFARIHLESVKRPIILGSRPVDGEVLQCTYVRLVKFMAALEIPAMEFKANPIAFLSWM